MKKMIYSIMTLIAAACCLASCVQQEKITEYSAGVFRLSKDPYITTDGSGVSPWVCGEKVGLIDDDGEHITSSAINNISGPLLFVFSIPAGAASGNMCFYYPYAESTDYSDGKLTFDLSSQTGEMEQYCASVYNGKLSNYSTSAPNDTLTPLFALVRVDIGTNSTISASNLVKIAFSGNDGEKVGGEATVDMSTGECEFTDTVSSVTFATPLEVSSSMSVYLAIAPGTYSKGYKVTVTDSEGNSNITEFDSSTDFEKGTVTTVSGKFGYTELAFVGSTNVYIINADTSVDDSLDVLWHWDSSKSDIPSKFVGMFVHCDDAKLVNDGTEILVTSSASTGGCALIDRQTQKCLFYARANNAHSATMLPDNRVVVACSTTNADRGNSLLVFDVDDPDVVKCQVPLFCAHGVQWIPSRQRLYAIGDESLVEYSLVDWDTDTPSLKVENVVTAPHTGLHDLTLVSDDELLCGGNSVYFYDLNDRTFTEVPQFHGETSVKSVNYNESTGVIWATVAEESWWTFHIKEFHIGSNDVVKVLSVPFDKFETNVYKCRVFQW
ncbi:MAG: DUF6528 family protein [Bacteroidales bacterium]|nr:DUF6528 family protein [Bacteroidales bacterium]MCI2121920.1 DUF6528 family protein [Bacteroidales bacterium]MCI2145618.1 DUF6528 family protein [Bacteroidales bacterium]